jgi:hypothetical protein
MKDTIDMAREVGLHLATDVSWMPIIGLGHLKAFEALVRADERQEMQHKIDTLHAMYEQACRQRDELMDQQRAQIEAMRGRIQ